jgi:hypothetical protein
MNMAVKTGKLGKRETEKRRMENGDRRRENGEGRRENGENSRKPAAGKREWDTGAARAASDKHRVAGSMERFSRFSGFPLFWLRLPGLPPPVSRLRSLVSAFRYHRDYP